MGFQQHSGIINENLTKFNKAIFDEAMVLRKARRLHQVFTNNGLVSIRTAPATRAIVIRSNRELYATMDAAASLPHQDTVRQASMTTPQFAPNDVNEDGITMNRSRAPKQSGARGGS